MRRMYGRKAGAQYPGRSVRLSHGIRAAARRPEECAEVSRGHKSLNQRGKGPNRRKREGPKSR